MDCIVITTEYNDNDTHFLILMFTFKLVLWGLNCLFLVDDFLRSFIMILFFNSNSSLRTVIVWWRDAIAFFWEPSSSIFYFEHLCCYDDV